jgi:hypothetical protein
MGTANLALFVGRVGLAVHTAEWRRVGLLIEATQTTCAHAETNTAKLGSAEGVVWCIACSKVIRP